ncbi:G-D-S-L family lipolytic protein [Aquimarina sp. MMG015]|uniref:G-D-S-L family lipolytic protein n=1 Tax=Aquimarina sp. MMG015 TaxID=2822689 RepID=UPI001B3A670B|nr:G-D-S-L family lipolytic protein [Aquimarina sp. MMG015]MBQ4803194.1 G-D-S-L family lipolytic protein [Aquimarina sp. MMG015]
MKNNIKYLAILALGLVACEPEFDNPIDDAGVYTSGEADFSNYVALGNSLTAGFADNALYITGQENSYPNILSQQFALAGGGDFTQPLMADNAGGALLGGTQILGNRLVLAFDADGNPGPTPYTGAMPTTEISNNLGASFNNMGVPGAKSFHLAAPGYGNVAGVAAGLANPYFARFASSADATVIADAVAQSPTFFSLWIGNNDILSYATSGGVGEDHNVTGNIDPTTYGGSDITNSNVFASVYSNLLDALTANGAKGVVLNLPSVTSLPFFTTVPTNAVPLDAQTAAFLNSQFAAYNTQILPGLAGLGVITAEEAGSRQINFVAGQNFVTIVDESLTDISTIIQGAPFNLDSQTAGLLGQLRQATSSDLIPLTSAGNIGVDLTGDGSLITGVSVPLGDADVLTEAEQAAVTSAQDSFNATIRALAAANGLAFVDVKSILSQAAGSGIPFDSGVVTSAFVTGGGFSLDGVHPTPRAHAILTNAVLEEIEETYGATLPSVNPGDYGTVTLSNEVN